VAQQASSASLEFWFEFGSTYSYPAAMRVEDVARAAGVALTWRPFLLGPIFRAQGWNDSPFNLYPVKGRYMWRDLERICTRLGLPFRRPTQFPRNGLLAARVAMLGADQEWGPRFVRAVYSANFADDRDIASEEVIGAVLAELGLDARDLLERVQAPANKDALRQQTERAVGLDIFGAPSFVARGELYWGNDRLEEAVAAAA
jgi:2-hydroxychromene-2-carboxylate isomerase